MGGFRYAIQDLKPDTWKFVDQKYEEKQNANVEQLTEEQRLTKAVVSIMGNPKYTALAGVLMIGDRNVVDDDSVPTACTNGRDEMYGREFVKQLNDAELRFLVLHEVYHKLFQHLTTWRHLYDQDAHLANMA